MIKRINWIIASFILVIIFGTIYLVVQQSQRNDANYPQIQIAEDTAAALNAGITPQSLLGSPVDINSSLAPFIVIYDKSGQVVASSGLLNGKTPSVPLGVLTSSNNKDYSFVTWQPQPGVRDALVSVAANKYYVLSGRSLKEVEKNENKTLLFAVISGVLSELLLSVGYLTNSRQGTIRK